MQVTETGTEAETETDTMPGSERARMSEQVIDHKTRQKHSFRRIMNEWWPYLSPWVGSQDS